jgi:hypothetical protein
VCGSSEKKERKTYARRQTCVMGALASKSHRVCGSSRGAGDAAASGGRGIGAPVPRCAHGGVESRVSAPTGGRSRCLPMQLKALCLCNLRVGPLEVSCSSLGCAALRAAWRGGCNCSSAKACGCAAPLCAQARRTGAEPAAGVVPHPRGCAGAAQAGGCGASGGGGHRALPHDAEREGGVAGGGRRGVRHGGEGWFTLCLVASRAEVGFCQGGGWVLLAKLALAARHLCAPRGDPGVVQLCPEASVPRRRASCSD